MLHANAIAEYCKLKFDWQELCPGDITNGTEHYPITSQTQQRDENQQHDECDVKPTRNPHSLFKVFNHIHEIKGYRDNMHVVRNTGIEGIVQY